MSDPQTVGTLRTLLVDLPDDVPIYLSKDEEGNGFKRLYDVDVCKYSDDGYDGHPIHPDDLDEYDPEYLIDAVVLWP
jgi:hypothetical protein